MSSLLSSPVCPPFCLSGIQMLLARCTELNKIKIEKRDNSDVAMIWSDGAQNYIVSQKCTKIETVLLEIITIDFDDIWQKSLNDSRIELACFSFM